jgi:O-6-methylguanine DNA methyltransferase
MGIERTRDVFFSLKFGEFSGTEVAIPELDDYFEGRQKNVVLRFNPIGTNFQIQVWRALILIPYGQLLSYQDIAHQIGRPTAVRAVANAIAANPLHILVPCHRVIRTDGRLGGYQGGIHRKKQLLQLESQIIS